MRLANEIYTYRDGLLLCGDGTRRPLMPIKMPWLGIRGHAGIMLSSYGNKSNDSEHEMNWPCLNCYRPGPAMTRGLRHRPRAASMKSSTDGRQNFRADFERRDACHGGDWLAIGRGIIVTFVIIRCRVVSVQCCRASTHAR